MRTARLLPSLTGRYGAAAVVFSLLLLGSTDRAAAEELPEPISSDWDHYEETLLSPEPVDGDALPLDPEPYVNAEPWWRLPDQRRPMYFARFRGGMSYFDVRGDAKLGGEYGADVLAPLVGPFAGYANISANHVSAGIQLLGTVGLMKVGALETPHRLDRFGGTVLFDQFTDSRIDDLYLSSLRVDVHYVVDRQTVFGAVYSEPLEEDEAEFILFPGATPISIDLASTRSVRAYVARRTDAMTFLGWVGYRDVANTVGYGGAVRRPVSDRVTAVVQATYEEAGLWSGFAGFEIALGPKPRACRSRRPCCEEPEDPATAKEVVRGGAKTEAYYVIGGEVGLTTVKGKSIAKKGGLYESYQVALSIADIEGQSASDYGLGVSGMEQTMQMMQMMENGGIDFSADCDSLVGELLTASNGDVIPVLNALIQNGRTDCLGDPRLGPQ